MHYTYRPNFRNKWEQGGNPVMRRLLWLVCLCFSVSSVGCFKFIDDIRRDNGHISKVGASARARQIEDNVDWGTSF